MSITDVAYIRAEELALGPGAAEASIEAAALGLKDVAAGALPLAA